MSIYRYSGASVIKDVVFHHALDRPLIALLSAADTATSPQLDAVRTAIEAAGLQQVPAYFEGKPVLQISGFKHEADLNLLLHKYRFTESPAGIIRQPGDDTKLRHWEKIQRISLKLAGAFNMLGTVGGVLAGGIREKDSYRKTAAILYLLSEGNLIRYGNAKSEHYAQEAAEDLGDFIRQQGGTLSDGSAFSDIMRHKRKGVFAKIDNFLYRHPTQVTFALSSTAASAMLGSGIKDIRKGGSWGTLGFGIGSVGLKVASLLIPEKSREEIQKDKAGKQNVFEKAVTWIQEKPLRFYGFGSLLTDAFLPLDAYQKYQKKEGWIYPAIAGTGYTVADVMYSVSSKEHSNENNGKFTADEQRSLEAMAAESLMHQPEAARAGNAQKLGTFLARRKEMRGSSMTIRQSILEQARHNEENPWVRRVHHETEGVTNTLPSI